MVDMPGNILAQLYYHILPEIALLTAACVIFLGGTFRADRHLWATVALLSLFFAFIMGAASPAPLLPQGDALYANPLLVDSLALLVRAVALGSGAVLVLFSWNEVPDRQAADFFACLLVILAGVSLVGSANDLVVLFVALELISIPTYILLYLPRFDDAAQEATIKYFLLSVFSSAVLLFGFSYLYGLAGTTNLSALHHTLQQQRALHVAQADTLTAIPAIAEIALVLIVAGLGFRITAAPFHFYAPDVYQGAPTVGAALLAFVPKVAGFVALLRLLGFVLPGAVLPPTGLGLSTDTPILLWFLAAVTMFLGNLLALWQDNLKRLLAYSSVAHAGYMLIALAAAPFLRPEGGGLEAVLFYLVAYGAMTIGAFGVIAYLSNAARPVTQVDDLAGLSRSHPGVALLMAIFLFSLIGLPLTAGFTGKFLIFFGALGLTEFQGLSQDGAARLTFLFRLLAVLGIINAAIGAWYYLRIVAVMYLRNPLQPVENRRTWPGLATLWICALLTLGLGVPPGATWLLQAARAAAAGAQPIAPASVQR